MRINQKALVPFLLVFLALAARIIPGPRTIDDSFITFRYARNLLSGDGFVYNPGEQVLGTTTPLYALLMAGLGVFSGGASAPFPALALAVNALADAGTCLLLWQLGRRLKAEWVGIAAAVLWAVAPFSVTFSIGGLETSVYVFLLTLVAWGYVAQRRVLTALAASLAFLTRPDALILLGPFALDRLYRAWKKGERLTWGEIAALLPAVAWYGFAWIYFGSPLPHSIQAKIAAYNLLPGESLIRLIQHYATPFMVVQMLGSAISVGIGLLLYPFLYAVGARRAFRAGPRLLAWLAYPWLYFITFALPNPLIFRWYLTPPLPAYFLVILLGTDQLLRAAFARRAQLPLAAWRRWAPAILLVGLPLFPLLGDWTIHPDHGLDQPAPQMAFYKLELLYRQAAQIVAPQETSTSILAAGDVGVLGFFTPGRILDTVGLNSPVSTSYYPINPSAYVINYAIPANLILDQKPDFVVILEVYGRLTLLADPRFQSQYQLQQTLPTDIYGSRGLLIFKRAVP